LAKLIPHFHTEGTEFLLDSVMFAVFPDNFMVSEDKLLLSLIKVFR
jgi:hypothetical protein